MFTDETHTPELHGVLEDASTAQLVREAFEEGKELIKLEVELARDEALEELKQVKTAAIGFVVALAATTLMFAMLGVALVFALGATWVAALEVAAGFLVVSSVAGLVAYSKLPMKPLEKTRGRLKSDISQLKEHLA